MTADIAPPVSDGNRKSLSDVVECLDQGVAVFDDNAELVLANASMLSMNPALQDVLIPGLPWSIFLREAINRGVLTESVSRRLDAIEAGFAGDPSKVDPVRMPSGQGKEFAFRIGTVSDGGFVFTQSLHIDKASEVDAAREAENLLRLVLEACPTSLIMSRVADGQIIYRSPAATELLGTAKSSFAHFAHAEERADFVTLLLPDAAVDNMRVNCLRPDGQVFPADISARLIDYRGEDVIVANIEDLTNELAVRAELDRKKEQLFQSEKLSALGELLAGIAHELNNPLSIIVGNADILHEELEETDHERRITKLTQAAHRCVRIVRSFLSLAREEPLDLHPVDPVVLIDAAIEAVAAESEIADITLETTLPTTRPIISADSVQLTQVLINLLTNAIHAIQGSGAGDKIIVDCVHDRDVLRLSVIDNGPGVSDDIKTRIFDPLFTTKSVGKGTGVGLAYCQRIVIAHKGQIRVEGEGRGKGATFTIELPLLPSDRNPYR